MAKNTKPQQKPEQPPAPDAAAGTALDSAATGTAVADTNSQAPDTGHTDSQATGEARNTGDAVEQPGAQSVALGEERLAQDAVEPVIDQDKEPEGGWCYPVLTPFKFRGVTLKEGFVQLTTEEAAPYLSAGVVGDDVCFPPEASEAAE